MTEKPEDTATPTGEEEEVVAGGGDEVPEVNEEDEAKADGENEKTTETEHTEL